MGLSLKKLLKWEDKKNILQMTGSLKLQLGLRQHWYQIHKNHSLQFFNKENI